MVFRDDPGGIVSAGNHPAIIRRSLFFSVMYIERVIMPVHFAEPAIRRVGDIPAVHPPARALDDPPGIIDAGRNDAQKIQRTERKAAALDHAEIQRRFDIAIKCFGAVRAGDKQLIKPARNTSVCAVSEMASIYLNA